MADAPPKPKAPTKDDAANAATRRGDYGTAASMFGISGRAIKEITAKGSRVSGPIGPPSKHRGSNKVRGSN